MSPLRDAQGPPGTVWAILPALAVAVLGGLCSGSGFLNGDAAVYVHQAAQGDLGQRWVHLGWLVLGAILAPLMGAALPQALDVCVSAAAAVAVGLIGRAQGVAAAWCAAAVVLPLCAFAEVDVPWAAALVGSAVLVPRAAVAASFVAVSLSPAALLGLPWVSAYRRDGWPVLGAAMAVLVLTAVSGGAWWVGDRGVLSTSSLNPWRSLLEWGQWPWWLIVPAVAHWRTPEGLPRALLLAPLLLAPADVPTWVFVGWALCLSIARAPRWWVMWVVLISIVTLGVQRSHVGAERVLLRSAADALHDGDGLATTWSRGVRVSLLVTGDPYSLLWRSTGGFVRDQRQRWCAEKPARVLRIVDHRLTWGRPHAEVCTR